MTSHVICAKLNPHIVTARAVVDADFRADAAGGGHCRANQSWLTNTFFAHGESLLRAKSPGSTHPSAGFLS